MGPSDGLDGFGEKKEKKSLAPLSVEFHKHVLKAQNPRLTDIEDIQLMQHRAEGTIRRIVNGNVFIELFARSVSQASDLKLLQQNSPF